MATLSAKSKIQMSKTECKSLADKPTEETELIDIACSATSFSIDVGESTSVDTTTICDDAPQSEVGFPGDSTASATLFYSSNKDSAYRPPQFSQQAQSQSLPPLEITVINHKDGTTDVDVKSEGKSLRNLVKKTVIGEIGSQRRVGNMLSRGF